MWGELAHSFQSGNAYIITVLIICFVATTILFERMIMLHYVYSLDFNKFIMNLKKMVNAEDLDRAVNLCRSASRSSLPKISLKALEAAQVDPTTVRGTIEEETIAFLPKIESRIAGLPALATLVMLVGVLGTIDSLWAAFHSVDVLDTAKKQASLAQGVAGSLNPTAISLIGSLIILAGHQFVKGIALRLTEKIHHGVTVLHNLLVPQEMAAFVPMAGAASYASEGGGDSPAQFVQESQTPSEEVSADDAFDDAAVEDIKDEEEII